MVRQSTSRSSGAADVAPLYRQLLDHLDSGVAIYQAAGEGEDFVFLDFNPAAERIDRISRAEVIGRRVTEVFPGVREFGLLGVLRRVWLTGAAERHPVSHYRDGRIDGWRDNQVFRLPGGEVVAVYEDRTAEKEALNRVRDLAHALTESEHRFRTTFEQAAVGMSASWRSVRLGRRPACCRSSTKSGWSERRALPCGVCGARARSIPHVSGRSEPIWTHC